MKRNWILKPLLLCLLPVLLASCENSPTKRLIGPEPYDSSGQWSGKWVVYDDQLRSDGGVMFIGWGEGFSVDFNSIERPYSGTKCIKVKWDGSDVTTAEGVTGLFTGFSLIVAKDYNYYSTTTKDLTSGAYTTVRFRARKEFLSSNTLLRFEGPIGDENSTPPDNAWQGTLSDNWQEYSFNISGNISSVHRFVTAVLKTTDNAK